MAIPFHKPYFTGRETQYINEAQSSRKLSNGVFTRRCEAWIEKTTKCKKAFLTPSCTAALEMAAILLDIQPGDEIIMPSYTFSSTANAFVLRGGVPVFVDIRTDTLNIDEKKIEAAITPKTKVIVPVHYGGVSCEMDTIMEIAKKYHLYVVEDAAQAVFAMYNFKQLGSLGHLGVYSFHETNNIISGEGGALLINDPLFLERAQIIREKGTNRTKFFRGEADEYSWMDKGSSFLTNELTAAFLWAQLEEVDAITHRRLSIWGSYHAEFEELEQYIGLPFPPWYCQHNAHTYFLLISPKRRLEFVEKLKTKSIYTAFHYVPLHQSPAGKRYGRTSGKLVHTERVADRIVRLPLWLGVEQFLDHIIKVTKEAVKGKKVRVD